MVLKLARRSGGTSDALPDPQHENGADRRHDEIAEPAVERDVHQVGEGPAHERARDADEQIGEKAVVARRDLLGDIAGNDADDQHAEEADARHGQQGLRFVHRDLPVRDRARHIAPPMHIGGLDASYTGKRAYRMRCQTRMQMTAPAVAMMISPMMLEAPIPRRPASSPPTTAPMMPIRRLIRRSWRRPRIQEASAPAIRPTTRKMIMPMMLLSPCSRAQTVPGQGYQIWSARP